MRVVGVIAEYDPFHLGHAHHLAEARRLTGADAVIAVMSTVFTQRGATALLSPDIRAEMALRCGADAVIALPALWAVRDAEHFALGGVSLLDALGCDCIAFGAETADLPRLQAAASLIEQPTSAMQAALRCRLDAGLSHPTALSAAADEVLPGAGALLCAPNNTLALCYLRAMLRLGAKLEPVAIQRSSDYHATGLDAALPSATAVRGAALRGDWRGVQAALPPAAHALLAQAALDGQLLRPDALDQALLYRLRTMSAAEWAALPGLSEGLEDRLMKAAHAVRSREELLDAAGTRRYPRARLSRLCTHALLGFTQALFDQIPLPASAWLLGFREDAAPLLARLSQGRIPLCSRAAELSDAPWFAAEQRAWDIWALGAGLPAGMACTRRMIRLPR